MAVSVRALGDAAFAAAWAEGEALAPEQAVTEALDPSLRAAANAAAGPAPALAASPTARQAQIVPLLAAGMTAREIADTLCRRRRTVEHHLGRLAAQLGVRSRTAIVSAVHEAGLLPPKHASDHR